MMSAKAILIGAASGFAATYLFGCKDDDDEKGACEGVTFPAIPTALLTAHSTAFPKLADVVGTGDNEETTCKDCIEATTSWSDDDYEKLITAFETCKGTGPTRNACDRPSSTSSCNTGARTEADNCVHTDANLDAQTTEACRACINFHEQATTYVAASGTTTHVTTQDAVDLLTALWTTCRSSGQDAGDWTTTGST
jgi:hypothetical protein